MTKYPIFLFLLIFCFFNRPVRSQIFVSDSAFVIIFYSIDKKNSNDSFYKVNYTQTISFCENQECRFRFDDVEKRNSAPKWSIKKWQRKLNIKNANQFVNKMPVTSYAIQNMIPNELRSKLIEYDSLNRYANGAAVDVTSSFSPVSFIKVFKVFCEGYLDSSVNASELNAIYHGVGNSTFTTKHNVSVLGNKHQINSNETKITHITVELSVNKSLLRERRLTSFFEMRGRILKEYSLVVISNVSLR